jgi:glutaconyl-CoA/methylmalonyl-CoA decarboxylase subunit gamma
MDFMLALNVTIYGLGIVFLALLVLMVAIMLLTKVFSMATGRELVSTLPAAAPATAPAVAPIAAAPVPAAAPSGGEAAEPVNAPLPGKVLSVAVKVGDPVKKGDELCVIEAMKMGNSIKAPRDGFVVEVCVAQGNVVAFGASLVFLGASAAASVRPVAAAAPAAPAAAADAAGKPAAFTLGALGQTHAVELVPAGGGTVSALLDGTRYDVRRDGGNPTRLTVNGQAHSVEVKEIAGTSATVVIDGATHKLEVGRPPAPRAFSLTSGGTAYRVELIGDGGAASVTLDGTAYRVERDKVDPSCLLVNGQTHVVEVKASTGTCATVVIDGRIETVQIAREVVSAAAPAPAGSVAPTPAPAAIGLGERVTAPLPGKILSVAVKAGDRVKKGDELCVIEAMKMGNSIKAQRDGLVNEVVVAPGQTVAFGAPLVVLD